MARVLIIGYGNPLRGDDGVGWRAAEALSGSFDPEHVEVVTAHQLTPELAEAASRVTLLVLIDAACNNGGGEVVLRTIEPDRSPSELFTHRLTPEVLLGVAHQLYGSAPKTVLASVGACSFEYGEGLSPAVESALPALLEKIRKVCGAHLRADGDSYHS